MTAPDVRLAEETALILAPFGHDAALIHQALHIAGVSSRVFDRDESLSQALEQSGCAIIAAEALEPKTVQEITGTLEKQLPWSDLPLIILCAPSTSPEFDASIRSLGNVTAVQRPLAPASLISVVCSALRARRRQYQVRDLLRESQLNQIEIQELNERLQRAMTETHHRVKNNLQTIAAMVDMRVMEAGETIATEEVVRIGQLTRSLAVVHDILTRQAREDGEARFVSARTVIEKLITMLKESTPHRPISLAAEDAQVTSRQGTSLALVLSELIGNAIKHGNGPVEVEFRVSPRQAELLVSDEGPGFPGDFKKGRSFNTGLELVERLVDWDLAGTVAFENRESGGACVRVTVPLKSAF